MSDFITVRAKFRCLEVTKRYSHTVPDGAEGVDRFGYKVRLAPVYGSTKNGKPSTKENESFFAQTPSGEIELGLVSEDTAKAFVPGVSYYIDFTPTDG